MPITPKNLVYHELIGLGVRVIRSRCRGYRGISGVVVDETRNTLVIEGGDGKRRRVVKDACLFHFRLPTGCVVAVDGRVLVGRPEDRLGRRPLRRW